MLVPSLASASDGYNASSENACEDSTLDTVAETTTKITTTVTRSVKHINAATGQVVTDTVIANDTYHDDDDQPYTDITTTATGIYNTTFTTSGTVNVGDTRCAYFSKQRQRCPLPY